MMRTTHAQPARIPATDARLPDLPADMVAPCHCSCVTRTLSSFFFFFSSRRRHTRCSRDWSSDVCSSDLEAYPRPQQTYCGTISYEVEHIGSHQERVWLRQVIESGEHRRPLAADEKRSEEGRVGKEGRFRGWPYH